MTLSDIKIDEKLTAFETCEPLKKIVKTAMDLVHNQQFVSNSETCFYFWKTILKITIDAMFEFVAQLDDAEIDAITTRDHRTISDANWPVINLALNEFNLISIEASRLFLRSINILKNRRDFNEYLTVVLPFPEKIDYKTVLSQQAGVLDYINLIFNENTKTKHSMWSPCEKSTQNTLRILQINTQKYNQSTKRQLSYVYESILLLFIEHHNIKHNYGIDMKKITGQSLYDTLLNNLSKTDVVPYRFFDAYTTMQNIEFQKYTYLTLSPLIAYLRKTLLLSTQVCLFFCQKTKDFF